MRINTIDDFLKELEIAHAANLHILSLFGALTLPDICSSLISSSGKTNRDLYLDWYEKYVTPNYRTLPAEVAYGWRCSTLHQGTSMPQTCIKLDEKQFKKKPELSKRGHVYLYSDGTYISRYNGNVFSDSVLTGNDGNPELNISELWKNPNIEKTILDITSGRRHSYSPYTRIALNVTASSLNVGRHKSPSSNEILVHVDPKIFIPLIINKASEFCHEHKNSETFKINIANFIRFRPNGFPHAQFPLIA